MIGVKWQKSYIGLIQTNTMAHSTPSPTTSLQPAYCAPACPFLKQDCPVVPLDGHLRQPKIDYCPYLIPSPFKVLNRESGPSTPIVVPNSSSSPVNSVSHGGPDFHPFFEFLVPKLIMNSLDRKFSNPLHLLLSIGFGIGASPPHLPSFFAYPWQ